MTSNSSVAPGGEPCDGVPDSECEGVSPVAESYRAGSRDDGSAIVSLNVARIVSESANSMPESVGATPSAATSDHIMLCVRSVPPLAIPPDSGAVYVTVGVEPVEASVVASASVAVPPASRTTAGPAVPPGAMTEATALSVRPVSLSATVRLAAASVPAAPERSVSLMVSASTVTASKSALFGAEIEDAA